MKYINDLWDFKISLEINCELACPGLNGFNYSFDHTYIALCDQPVVYLRQLKHNLSTTKITNAHIYI